MASTTYLVGGAVRDELLGLDVTDRDWVVVGATVDDMLAAGYTQVGRDFPVFLHPHSNDEYALARTERKQGSGHTGFAVHASPDVTLEEDLARRDLTINAIAKDGQGALIDPFGGQADLAARILKHVSPAFVEDPLRVFRVARFYAALPEFEIAPDTLALMREISLSGELETLSRERVWTETHKALSCPDYHRYFEALHACQAMEVWFAELAGCNLPLLHQRPELNAADRYALLPLAPDEFSSLNKRLGVPKHIAQQASDRVQFETVLRQWSQQGAGVLLPAFEQLGVQHNTQRLVTLLDTLALEHEPVMTLARGFAEVKLDADTQMSGAAYGQALRQARLTWLQEQEHVG